MPKGSATRGESAAFINRMLKVIESNNEKAFAIASAFYFSIRYGRREGF